MRIRNIGLITLSSLAFASSPLLASVLEEVVVTAQKREQNLQDVSVSVAAFSGDTMKELGIQDPRDIANLIPNVTVNSAQNFPSFNVRGIQLLDFGDGNESPISFYVDEIYYGTPAGQTAGLFDVERAEVLRGPQGTLFGRNSTGGLVHFISNKPTEEFQLSGSLELASDDEVITQLAVGGGLTDSIRGRLAAKLHERDGWQRNNAGQDTGAVDSLSIRGMLEFDLSDSLTALVTLSHSDIDDTPAGTALLGLNDPNIPVPNAFGPGVPGFFVPCTATRGESAVLNGECVDIAGQGSNKNPELAGTTERLKNDVELHGATLKLDWDISDTMELVSITSFNTVEKQTITDPDASPSPFGLTLYTVESEALTQELRLSGDTDSLKWIAGAFYYDEEKDPLRFEPIQQVFAPGPNQGNPFGLVGDAILETTSWAVFGQAEFEISDQITLIGGLRYTDEKKELTIANDLDNPVPDPNIPGSAPFITDEEIDEEKVTGRLGLDWRPTEEDLVYLSIATGYKSGAFNANFAAPGRTAPSDSEEVVNYELGWKTSLLDDTLRLNTSVFYSDYSDLQSVIVPPGTISGAVINVGDADIYGAELEITWIASDSLDVVFGLGLLDSEIDSDNASLDGNELPYTAGLSGNALVRYTLPVDLFGGEVVWTNALKYVDEHFQSVQNDFPSVQEEYTVWDTFLRWNSADSRYFVELFVKNVGDKDFTVERFQISALGVASTKWERTRHGGIRVGFDFE